MKGSETIQETVAKGKALLDDALAEWGLFLAVTVAILASFGLGRVSAVVDAKPLVEVQAASPGGGESIIPGGLYVASRSGSTYYFPWCAGAKNIATENERWFASVEEAKRAGYRPAKNCKGLE